MSGKSTKNRIDTMQLKPSECALAIKHMVAVNMRNASLRKKRRGLFIWGGPGIAKSSVTEQVAKEMNLKLIDIRLSQMEPTDLRGIPVPETDAVSHITEVVWAIPKLFPKRDTGKRTSTLPYDYVDLTEEQTKKVDELVDKEQISREDAIVSLGYMYSGAIILLDELPNAAQSVQAGSYQLVLDGALGEYIVPDNVIVMAAGNRETDKASTFRMPSPLLNRFTHIEMQVNFEDWQQHALSKLYDRDVVGYVSFAKQELYQFDPSSASRGFATPRTWETVSDILYDNPALPETVLMALVAGAVGDGTATKFIAYRRSSSQLPNPSDILDGKVKELKNREISLMYALTTGLCYELQERFVSYKGKPTKESKERFDKSVDIFLGFMMENFQEEMVIMGARTALSTFQITFDPSKLTNWTKFSDKFQDLILAA